MRLREAGVPESAEVDIQWHSSPIMTRHYSVAPRGTDFAGWVDFSPPKFRPQRKTG